ncbi:MAG TPA: hypothetical protein VJZ72_03675 [Candidatus Limnocylindrales bacterium]|nr:hypothetical protein [Candidatus Limnocylindrales bacterium]
MAEILTESFCERCGTRYTFEASAPRKGRVGKFRTLSRGLKNYVLSDESTFEEALDEARGEEERALSTQQLDAFHQTFNFCMTCRQYTCANCWNELEARCLSCAPDFTHDVLPAAFPDLPIVPALGDGSARAAPQLVVAPDSSWPSSDMPAELANGTEAETPGIAAASSPEGPTIEEQAADDEPDERLVARLTALGAVRVVPALGPQTIAPPVEPQAPEPEAPIDAGPPVPEPAVADDEGEIAAMIAAAAAVPVEAREPVQADRPETTPEPEPSTPAPPASLPAAATLAEPVGWTMVAPETPLLSDDRVAATQPSGNGHHPAPTPTPAWPTPSDTPQWPTAQARPAPLAADTNGRHGTAALWVASTRDVVSHPGSGISACVSCGLPLSANARFCRRCGSRQDS